jgi:HSP20 family protein
MTRMLWRPANPASGHGLLDVHDEVNRLFDSVFSGGARRVDAGSPFNPAVDVEETPEGFVIRADVPGIARQDIKVSLMGDTLTLSGERKAAAGDGSTLHRRERTWGAFERSFRFGVAVQNDGVKAEVRDGVLVIHVPKAQEARPREIEIQVGS